jgi:hypothetical protein
LKLNENERGITLRAYLAEKLQCDPMRITKKYTGASCLGKRVYRFDYHNADHMEAERLRQELQILEHNFKMKLEQMNRKKLQEHGNMDESYRISTPAIDALLQRTKQTGHPAKLTGPPLGVLPMNNLPFPNATSHFTMIPTMSLDDPRMLPFTQSMYMAAAANATHNANNNGFTVPTPPYILAPTLYGQILKEIGHSQPSISQTVNATAHGDKQGTSSNNSTASHNNDPSEPSSNPANNKNDCNNNDKNDHINNNNHNNTMIDSMKNNDPMGAYTTSLVRNDLPMPICHPNMNNNSNTAASATTSGSASSVTSAPTNQSSNHPYYMPSPYPPIKDETTHSKNTPTFPQPFLDFAVAAGLRHPLQPPYYVPPPSLNTTTNHVNQQYTANTNTNNIDKVDQHKHKKAKTKSSHKISFNNGLPHLVTVHDIPHHSYNNNNNIRYFTNEEDDVNQRIHLSEQDQNEAASSLLGFINHVNRNGSQEDLVEFYDSVQKTMEKSSQQHLPHSQNTSPMMSATLRKSSSFGLDLSI